VSVFKRTVSLVILLFFLGSQQLFAQIVAHPGMPASLQPKVLPSATGVPVVDIQTPSRAGVSRNVYSQFDVQSQGAVLNNSPVQSPSQLAGVVVGNPWLATTGSAKVILNEVYSSNPSQLNGMVEVTGRSADVVVANPSGITVNGGGFINANRATLTTGVPVLGPNGSIQGYNVFSSAQVQVQGNGLNTASSDYTDILSRAALINANIWANNLTVSTGTGIVSADGQGAWTQQGSATGVKPSVSIDTSALGACTRGRFASSARNRASG